MDEHDLREPYIFEDTAGDRLEESASTVQIITAAAGVASAGFTGLNYFTAQLRDHRVEELEAQQAAERAEWEAQRRALDLENREAQRQLYGQDHIDALDRGEPDYSSGFEDQDPVLNMPLGLDEEGW